ncbi:RNA polymerase sigma factor [Saccharibacillus sp. CPCC 101409]|uniref:RNA polymerase sigma factor n=1 Tax=Saccharibacillus sp. CPCC 101409 TaxID=3058041 RepID=UPI002673EEFF|nr:RNA polymerase sigma factor [Saccharibacillus sp. CPCC 101409]MDO3408500.1 RNA polymerase sigma factor [Saccharibacillus sp. CPCC 101409]
MDDKELFETYKEAVFHYCLYMLRSRADAEDICQEVFVKALVADRSRVEHIKAWLMRIAANECHSMLRRKTNGQMKEKRAFRLNLPLRPPQSVEKTYEASETSDEFEQLLGRLKPKLREALLLYYIADLSTAETAEALNVPVGTVKSRISRGLNMLKKFTENQPALPEKEGDVHASNC